MRDLNLLVCLQKESSQSPSRVRHNFLMFVFIQFSSSTIAIIKYQKCIRRVLERHLWWVNEHSNFEELFENRFLFTNVSLFQFSPSHFGVLSPSVWTDWRDSCWQGQWSRIANNHSGGANCEDVLLGQHLTIFWSRGKSFPCGVVHVTGSALKFPDRSSRAMATVGNSVYPSLVVVRLQVLESSILSSASACNCSSEGFFMTTIVLSSQSAGGSP